MYENEKNSYFDYTEELANLEQLKYSKNLFQTNVTETLENFNELKKIRDELKKKMLFEVIDNMNSLQKENEKEKEKENNMNIENDKENEDTLSEEEFYEAIKIFGLEEKSINDSINNFCDNYFKFIKVNNFNDNKNDKKNHYLNDPGLNNY